MRPNVSVSGWQFCMRSTIHPRVNPLAHSISPIFALPDWHDLFDRVNEPLAGSESVVAVRRADGDGDADRTQFQVPQAVNDGAADNRPAPAGFGLQFRQLLLGHFR